MAKKVQVKDVFSGRRDTLSNSIYNKEMQGWSTKVQQMAKAAASAFRNGKKKSHTYLSGPKKGYTETILRNHIQYQLKSDVGEIAGVAFQFPVHGIFIEYGVGRGSRRGNSSRTMSDWLSGTLDKNEEQLVNIVSEHQSDRVIRVFAGVRK